MKRIVAVGLAILLMIGTGCTAFAAVDLSVFENAEGVKYTYDDMDDTYVLESEVELVDLLVDFSGVFFIDVKGGESVCTLRLMMLAVKPGGKKIGFNGVIVKTDAKKYSFDISDAADVSTSTAGIETGAYILGLTGIQMLKDILDSTGDVKIRFEGENENIDFIMSDAQKSVIDKILTLYIESGAPDQEILPSLETVYPITVK